ncbi:ribonuclease Oy [Rhipicephalus microplus]|uniref:ribonuclease Oy n=1 Tax=Rhipicephalus microplus TaxID=6941 RepID=UPI003F6B2D1C
MMHCLTLQALLLAYLGGLAACGKDASTVTYFMFSQQWSTGYCSAAHDKCIKENERNFWTVHGLWPSSNSSTPEFCNRTLRYNATTLGPLVPQLDLYWPSLTSSNNNIFWKHEWQKHGTCATIVPELDGLYNFFNETLTLYLKYNITEYLLNSGVVPTSEKTYQLQTIKNALHDDIKGAANFVCYSSRNYSAPVLAEIRFCLDRQLQPIDCKAKHSGCGQGNVYYLAFDKDGATSQTSPLSWLLHCSWLFAVSVIPMPLYQLR